MLVGKHLSDINKIKSDLNEKFKMKDLGICEYVLGLHVEITDEHVKIHQRKYIQETIQAFNLMNAKTVSISADNNVKTRVDDGVSQLTDARQYRGILGKLQYISIGTRPDISFAVGKAGRYNQNPTRAHRTAADRILKYLKGTCEKGITYLRGKDGPSQEFRAFVDADHAGDPETRKSTTGYLIEYAGGPISWRSKRQGSITLSTYEAELVALSHVVSEIDWLVGTLTDVRIETNLPIVVHCDNDAAVITANADYSRPIKSRTVELRKFHIREKVLDGLMRVVKVAGEDNTADILTKPLPATTFGKFRDQMLRD